MEKNEEPPGNVIPAIGSLIIPGVGQFMQHRYPKAAVFLALGIALWALAYPYGSIVHLWACLDAGIHQKNG